MGNLTIISETGFPHAACLFEYAEVKTWCGFKPKIPKFPAFWGYVDRSDRAIYTKKSIRFEIPDQTLQEAIAILEEKYTNRWFSIWWGINCIDFAIEAAKLCKLQVPIQKKLFPCDLIHDLKQLNF
ncbi:hypothetical protein [Pseudanabaena minima]|uniref:hypothetical protein n=1 Tax=Pseudanabaena minima TaxID=890415 RepID=UPI003DA953A1